ncbi:MAG: 2,3-bisphosphoglycerate-independent phosphoglycerate mutase [Bacteroidetes bacterium]|nr:MAG: 2,3-bisphosphoglycerate-independent phosphoglycerate mutase [Bacteroidota bacterium]
MHKKVLLMILDGWGIATNKEVSAIDHASTPFMDSLYEKYPHATLQASGLAVGLPEGQMGNSEVGHMNIGAGRVVYQDLVKINQAVADGSLTENHVLRDAYLEAADKNKAVHLIGLVSDGGVHSHISHLKGLISAASDAGVKNLFVHAFTDGRDTDPKSGLAFIKEIEDHLDQNNGKLASVTGRYYAMDRDNRWERVKLAYDAMVNGVGELTQDIDEAIAASYEKEVTDEFLNPIIHADENGQPLAKIKDGDTVISFNFRTDRGREITQALSQQDYHEFGMNKLDLDYITMTNYDESFKRIKVIYNKEDLTNTLGEVLEKAHKKQIRIAETEKYPHVTFFFSGGREAPFKGEKRILCPSPKVATYDLQPEMSAKDIAEGIIPELNEKEVDFVCLNFANPDMVGHTGVFEAAVKACETVDHYASDVVSAALENDYSTIIIADHGNPDMMINDDGSPNTAHTTNLVPFILVDNSFTGELKDGKLGDLAPTILSLMGLDIPHEMTGEILIS